MRKLRAESYLLDRSLTLVSYLFEYLASLVSSLLDNSTVKQDQLHLP